MCLKYSFNIFQLLHFPLVSPLVALAPVPAAHRRRPPRRPEDTLPPEITLKPPHRRAVATRRRTRQGTRQRQVLLTIIVPSLLTHPPTHSTTQPPTHPLNHSTTHSTTHSLTHSPTHSTTHPLNHSTTQPPTQPPTQPLTQPLTQSPNHPTTQPPTQPLNHPPTTHQPPTTHSPNHPLNHSLNHSTTHSLNHSTTHPLTHLLHWSLRSLHHPSITSSDAREKALDDIDERRISLGQLAGQLSDFIGGGDEVKDALLNGLHSNVNQLVGLLNKSCGGEGCCKDVKNFRDGHLKKLQKTFNDIDEIEREINGLKKQKDIAEKRKAPEKAPSVGESEIERQIEEKNKELEKQKSLVEKQINALQNALNQPKMKIQNTIDSLTAQIAELQKKIDAHKKAEKASKKDDKNISIPYDLSNSLATAQAKLQSHNASLNSLESLEKLITFHQSVKNIQDGKCKDILNNLCSGLEKFLGYQETSKGYDGSGIVYSDLDRLCDGVMAFLHSVLKDVHDKQPYIVGKEGLNENVVKHLKDNLCSGHDGFKSVIGQVAEGVGRYNREVESSNREVSAPIIKLYKEMEDLKNQVSDSNKTNGLQVTDTSSYQDVEAAVTKAGSLVDECLSHADNFENEIGKVRSETNDFNSILKTDVLRYVNSVTYAASVLKKCSTKEWRDKVNMENAIKKVLESLKTDVNTDIKKKVTALVEQLRTWVAEILRKLREIDGMLKEYVKSLAGWINDTKDFIDEVRKAHVAKIEKNEVGIKNRELIKNLSTVVTHKAEEIMNGFDAAEKHVKKQVTHALNAVKAMDQSLKTDLFEVKNKIKEGITALVKKARMEFETIKNSVQKGTGEQGVTDMSIDKKWEEFQKKIKEIAKDIYDEEGGPGKLGHLGFIAQGVREYAAMFATAGQFWNTVLPGWLTEVYSKETVKRPIQTYALSIQKPEAQVKAAIQHHITSLANKGSKTAKFTENVKDNLKNIQQFFTEFASAVDSTRPADMMWAIQTHLRLRSLHRNLSPTDDDLQAALTTILTSVQLAAKGAADELQDFIQTSNIDKFKEAIEKVKELNRTVNINGNMISVAVQSMTQPITALDTALKTADFDGKINSQLPDVQVSEGSQESKSQVYLTNLRTYITHVKYDAFSSHPTGNVPDAIAEIGNHGLDTLKGIIDTKAKAGDADEKGELYKLSEQITQNLTELMNEISNIGKGLEWNLMNIKDDRIGALLNEIRQNLDGLRNVQLANVIADAEAFDGFADALCNMTIKNLEINVNNYIEHAISTLTTRARRNYVTSVKGLLKSFAAKVTQELEPLPAQIDEDLRIGFKGFMKTLEDGTTEAKKNTGAQPQQLQASGSASAADQPSTLEEFKTVISGLCSSGKPKTDDLKTLADAFKKFWCPVAVFVNKEIIGVKRDDKEKKDFVGTHVKEYSRQLIKVYDSFNELLAYLNHNNRYDHELHGLLDNVNKLIAVLKPDGFAKITTPILDALKAGMDKFTKELGHAYVNAYSGQKRTDDWVKEETKMVDDQPQKITVLSTEGRNCAKVCLTIMERVSYDFSKLRKACKNGGGCENHKIILGNEFGRFFKKHGFEVSKDDKTQDGELKRDKTGKKMYGLLVSNTGENHVYKEEAAEKDTGPMRALHKHLRDYYRVCQLRHIPNARAPSTVNQMLNWLGGLRYNPMLAKLEGQFKELFDKPDGKEEKDYKDIDAKEHKLPATAPFSRDTTTTITAKQLHETLDTVCFLSEKMLIAFLGHGHEGGRYACEFNTNSDNLLYPNGASVCLDMLTDILNRVFYQLRFLFSQCNNYTSSSGWRDCWYGRGVGGSEWNCNALQCPNQQDDQIDNQTHKQTCNQHPKCGLKSPLQSFLEDGLQGFLPHTFTSPGCKLTCTVSNHFGKPCLTPMGFADIGVAASHTKDGEYLRKALEGFCRPGSDLHKLCSQLNCLTRRTPQTLGDMFGFYYNFLGNFKNKPHKEIAFDKAVKEANFGQVYKDLKVTSIQNSSTHTSHSTDKKNIAHLTGDLFSLVECKGENNSPAHPCGPYLGSITNDVCDIFSEKHADNYLSWIVYITERFYDLLKQLYEDCSSKCGGDNPKCRTAKCADDCTAKNLPMSELGKHHSTCSSIVKCPDTLPNLYKYGFTFGSPSSLCGEKSEATKRTCHDFCNTLQIVVKEKNLLHKLAHDIIPQFLFDIRAKFIWTLVALWSLSLLYLLHITVVRLDVLRIRSHLRSPSSHRIAAQSLLAAARVKALASVKYFSP
ncbi:hypothetical protein, conserved [Babesia ovata]|uniref:Extracellular matrix-binding ebh n=1 Tax=Babesia ovata TaxID=189622 RepID=A0A2H6KJ55_9APIC|nr:uncharacterized protein BOVATA_045200 [Babesia ovata]GBE63027.1 hypothetical protein, conserved [Babesia ovata]